MFTLLSPLLGACMNYPEFVEAKDVGFSEMKLIDKSNRPYLLLRGLVLHSALAVKAIEISSEAGQPWVLVRLTPAGKGLSGSFQVEVPLDSQESAVKFGPQKKVIWPIAPR